MRMDSAKISPGFLGKLCRVLPMNSMGFCRINVAGVMLVLSLLLNLIPKKK